MLEHLDLKDRVKSLEAQLKGSTAETGVAGEAPALKPHKPSAPSVNEETETRGAKGKSKAA